ncbi:MAG: hypothetical protein IKW89_04245 [Bacteroidales bacterium]|nr:hypothetical protein [Bacteroidales bacterium]
MQKTTQKPTRKSFGVTVYCRQQKIRRDGRAPVEVTVSVNGEKAMFQLTEAWVPSEFAKMRGSGRQNDVRRLCSEVTSKMASLHEKYPNAPAKTLKQYYLSGPPSSIGHGPTVSILCHSYLENVKKHSPSYDKYRVTFDRFCEWFGHNYASDVSSGDVFFFLDELRRSGLAEGTRRNYYKRLKSLFNYGFEKRAVTIHPFSGLKMTFKDPDPVYLTKEELDAMKKVDVPPYLARVRELFLFLCGTGIEWSDLEGLCPEDVQEQDGLRFIQKRRVKTGEPYRAYLIGDAPAIWDKYRGVLPLISNQKENKYIKRVVELAGVPKKVTTLTARHSYATALLSGSFGPPVSIDALKRVLGHAKMDQSLRYATLLDKSLDKAFEGYKQ